MTTQENLAAVAKLRGELATEHANVRALVGKLREPHATPHDTFATLDELHATLAKHFAHEELPGGFYETMGVCTPDHAEDLRVLVDQHFRIISAAQSLKERARDGREASQAFDGDLTMLVETIAGHERREHELSDAVSR